MNVKLKLLMYLLIHSFFDFMLCPKNHLIVKVPPYQNQSITSPVCVGIYVVTVAGRSHDVQQFTYNPDAGWFVSLSCEVQSSHFIKGEPKRSSSLSS